MIKTKYTERLSASHLFQGSTNNCGPFSAAIILKMFDHPNINGEQISKELGKIHWKGIIPLIRRVPNWATFPWGVADLFSQYGMTAKWRWLCTYSHLIENIKTDKITIVLIGSWLSGWAHYKILVAADTQNGLGFIDPGFKNPQICWQPLGEFLTQWRFFARSIIEVDDEFSNQVV
jgi:hypothetical protein